MNNNKRKYIIIGLIIICILAVIGIFKLVRNIQVAVEKNKRIELGKQKYDSDEFYIEKVIGEVLNRDADYDKLPLSENFTRKYKGKDIIEYEEGQECNFQNDLCYYNKDKRICSIRVSHPPAPKNDFFSTNEEVRVKYRINEFYELDDIEILKRRVTYKGGGEYVYYDMLNDTHNLLFYILSPWMLNDTSHDFLDVSESFKKKYPNYLLKSILDVKYKAVGIKDSDIKNEFVVELLDFDKTRYYKATMIPNKEHEEQLDDVIFEFIREEKPMDSKELRDILIDYGNPKIEGWPFDEYK